MKPTTGAGALRTPTTAQSGTRPCTFARRSFSSAYAAAKMNLRIFEQYSTETRRKHRALITAIGHLERAVAVLRSSSHELRGMI